MSYFEIKKNGKLLRIIGKDDQTTLGIRIVESTDCWDEPQIFADAYKLEGDELIRHDRWDFDSCSIGDELTIRIHENANPDKPTKSDRQRPKDTKAETIYLKEMTRRTKEAIEATKRLTEGKLKTNNKNMLYCSFCGKSQNEANHLVAGPSVFICDECIELCSEVISNEQK